MALLVLQPRPRPRLHARGDAAADAAGSVLRAGGEVAYALSPDGREIGAQGACAPALLPRATSVVLALGDADVAWHRIVLPRAPAGRLRAALAGVLEDALLDDADQVHLAVQPGATAGATAWIAAVHRGWLQMELAALEAAQVTVDRIVPTSWPDDPPTGHFLRASDGEGADDALTLVWAHADGVAVLPLEGGLARRLLPQPPPDGTRWSAAPEAAAAAERWLGAPVTALSAAERALAASRSLWNLRQFDLARKSRGTRAAADGVRIFLSTAWRPVRWGLAALLAAQVIGLNLWAWRLDATIAERRAEQVTLLQTTHPQVRAVLDAPLQMRRATADLRAAAGQPDDGDLEPLLSAAASAWPPDRPPTESIGYEPGRLTLGAAGWDAAQIEQLRERLRADGIRLESAEGRLVLTRAALPGGRP